MSSKTNWPTVLRDRGKAEDHRNYVALLEKPAEKYFSAEGLIKEVKALESRVKEYGANPVLAKQKQLATETKLLWYALSQRIDTLIGLLTRDIMEKQAEELTASGSTEIDYELLRKGAQSDETISLCTSHLLMAYEEFPTEEEGEEEEKFLLRMEQFRRTWFNMLAQLMGLLHVTFNGPTNRGRRKEKRQTAHVPLELDRP